MKSGEVEVDSLIYPHLFCNLMESIHSMYDSRLYALASPLRLRTDFQLEYIGTLRLEAEVQVELAQLSTSALALLYVYQAG